ncbi:MAG: serine protein kinase RIO [Candidatus Altiarchaeales archaeon]|nr:serine protein kinase RIO [Candidatus Altiarchaeales archaeon]
MLPDRFLSQLDLKSLKNEGRRKPSTKISQGVFDPQTLNSLYRLYRKGVFTDLVGLAAQGKEANLYWGRQGSREVAVKIYCVEATDFRNMRRYVDGDPRFPKVRDRRQLTYLWCRKEYSNLMRVSDYVRCPKPIDYRQNVLVMDFIGGEGVCALKLRDSELPDPGGDYQKIISYIKKMYELGLVHGDLSEYNILYQGEPVLIDFSQGVLREHPEAGRLLERDVINIAKFFRKKGVDADANRELDEVRGVG